MTTRPDAQAFYQKNIPKVDSYEVSTHNKEIYILQLHFQDQK